MNTGVSRTLIFVHGGRKTRRRHVILLALARLLFLRVFFSSDMYAVAPLFAAHRDVRLSSNLHLSHSNGSFGNNMFNRNLLL